MNILIIGSGGREHALAMAYSKSDKVKRVFVAPGNDFMMETSQKITTLPEIKPLDDAKILAAVKKYRIDLVDVAQDDPLAAGLVDTLQGNGIHAFGPSKKAAAIEWSKSWSRDFMDKYHLPIPQYRVFSDEASAVAYVRSLPEQPLYIKASGLAAGKGAIRAESKEDAYQAIAAMKQFNTAGSTFLIEECMEGEEFSLFAICDGEHCQVLRAAQDHKTVYAGNHGPNTGGMGCVAPTGALDRQTIKRIEKTILTPFLKGMQKEKRPYQGILYLGGMLTNDGVKIVEFNARWGDPETEVILPGLQTEYLDLVNATLTQKLDALTVHFDRKIRISVAGCARGYPGDFSTVKGKKIFGLQEAMRLPGITLFGAGIKRQGNDYVVNGGRVFHLVAEGATIQQARARAYMAMSQIYIEKDALHYRTDIGYKELERMYTV